jgi:hypothetical protein
VKALAKAVIYATQFLELADDTVVDPDFAVAVMESLAEALSTSGPEERRALQSVLEELMNREALPEADNTGRMRRQFYANFMESFGLSDSAED